MRNVGLHLYVQRRLADDLRRHCLSWKNILADGGRGAYSRVEKFAGNDCGVSGNHFVWDRSFFSARNL